MAKPIITVPFCFASFRRFFLPGGSQLLKAAVLGKDTVVRIVRQRGGAGDRHRTVSHGCPSMGTAPAVRAFQKSAQPANFSACLGSHTPRRPT